ncbi:MAG: branched-chain amino acid ABC transporter permease [Aigarchaeota archaeon]|nr:branched-chain amino acid ABC transporter permease [Aigarchaeota archaeon]MDW8092288.1 branched-chain amino acid ABC transporter permease [Nitrososphaerota archaeon]
MSIARPNFQLIAALILAFVISSAIAYYYVVYVMNNTSLLFAQLVTSGLMLGGIYGLAATGLTIIFGVMKIINLAHGELMMLGGFISLWISTFLRTDPLFVLPISFVVLFVIGVFFQSTLFNSAMRYGLNPPVFLAFAIALALQNLMILAWTADVRIIRSPLIDSTVQVEGVSIQLARFVSFILAIVLILLVKAFIEKTMIGKGLRAISQNREAAALMGINVSIVNVLAYSLGVGLAAIAGTMLGMVFSVSPLDGPVLTSKTIAIIVLGGIGSVAGALVGGLILGLIETYVGYIVGSGFINAVALLTFLLVLILRPSGLFGER